jgi:hypothetical protein
LSGDDIYSNRTVRGLTAFSALPVFVLARLRIAALRAAVQTNRYGQKGGNNQERSRTSRQFHGGIF